MVDAVKVRRDQHRLEVPLQPLGQANIAVLDSSRDENREAVAQRSEGGDIEHEHGEPISGRGEEDLDRVMPNRRGHVDVGIRVMRRVNAPEERHRVFQPVDEIMQKIEQQESGHQAQRGIGHRPGRDGQTRDG